MFRISQVLLATSKRRLYPTKARFSEATSLHYDGKSTVEGFNANEPAVFRESFKDNPAIGKWFTPSTANPSSHELNVSYLEQYGDSIVPLELTRSSPDNPHTTTFERFEAPLSLLLSHMTGPNTPSTRLYLAQHSLVDLPSPLQADLSTPTLLSHLGRGDIYASSLWMGRPPTRTPLHRDPNPNLFVQLAGHKVVRLTRPEIGRAVYERVRMEVGKQGGKANMRGEEMMEGSEMEGLERAIWGDELDREGVAGVEAELGSGDGIFIPSIGGSDEDLRSKQVKLL
ncbi:Clavaminate synthase-like protein [Cucurbitaria berberidis CBS 394.84]|uniref:Clavaminate synthase-like protein n=1 Tax=Cucurbitaria berberidis CBS 394.84 TaxID=1168544 RepID=A0A9P4G842_9PLEO|nr:Clavaminate synthase-like protein [Cucurbitaria berberidis CBS 394.84]KAF1840781.1 Clavaminate synthase-like protein [Cucurbitaria berberidis CBS 394.84]